MLVLIDNANLKEIESLYDMYPYDGVTTNPTILKNEHTNPIRLLKDIRSLLPAECQVACASDFRYNRRNSGRGTFYVGEIAGRFVYQSSRLGSGYEGNSSA